MKKHILLLVLVASLGAFSASAEEMPSPSAREEAILGDSSLEFREATEEDKALYEELLEATTPEETFLRHDRQKMEIVWCAPDGSLINGYTAYMSKDSYVELNNDGFQWALSDLYDIANDGKGDTGISECIRMGADAYTEKIAQILSDTMTFTLIEGETLLKVGENEEFLVTVSAIQGEENIRSYVERTLQGFFQDAGASSENIQSITYTGLFLKETMDQTKAYARIRYADGSSFVYKYYEMEYDGEGLNLADTDLGTYFEAAERGFRSITVTFGAGRDNEATVTALVPKGVEALVPPLEEPTYVDQASTEEFADDYESDYHLYKKPE